MSSNVRTSRSRSTFSSRCPTSTLSTLIANWCAVAWVAAREVARIRQSKSRRRTWARSVLSPPPTCQAAWSCVRVFRPTIGRRRSDQAARSLLFHHVGAPANDAARGERRGEVFCIDAQRVEQHRSVELHVGRQASLGVSRAQELCRVELDAARELELLSEPLSVACRGRRQRADGSLQDRRSRVAHAIHPVSHAHDALTSRERCFEPW